ncbi:hypothetical protein BABINDRAFT_172149 [Babjeviella inositovora NRRL Y-12698]|uniref:Uncharacterized protein n=1 Tax=Babjeviella inositovora NRRL Y-12698 TaxID=984486 RepID=A0A1E3QMI5_9ASCO|nr:uncharacterized protein BABINDRAFT_172149 [Babjeviella inositovora NRRL Y-12698]ODQ78893.1 hypothetical protein BABINDRAFT_172149 [Babjeviella inositovora NRRL Y-12698]
MSDFSHLLRSLLSQLVLSVPAKSLDIPAGAPLLAITFLQCFIQANYTGPALELGACEFLQLSYDPAVLQAQLVGALHIAGQPAYDLLDEALYLVLALVMFEKLSEAPLSLVNSSDLTSLEELAAFTEAHAHCDPTAPVLASLQWWRTRALQVHISVLPEPSSALATVSLILLNASVANALCPSTDAAPRLQKYVQLAFHLEAARCGIHARTEHLAVPLLRAARTLSRFQFVLTGAKAKRTQYQEFARAGLVILAASEDARGFSAEYTDDAPESFALGSDMLLERPIYEGVGEENTELEQEHKKRRVDGVRTVEIAVKQEPSDDDEETLLPVALRADMIPAALRDLDPNHPTALDDYDALQLLLRLTTIRQTTPANHPLVNEELLALVSRVLFAPAKSVNWSVYSRALWERSMVESTKAKTVERGVLQMQSLVEELGAAMKTRVFRDLGAGAAAAATRMQHVHQLPLMPRWEMEAKLAEKYMSLGILRSAVEIYERLHMVCEAALCYASVGDEQQAERLLRTRVDTHPSDARALSILGDIKQDPALWLRAWEVGRYANAKTALARYCFSPPRGVSRDLPAAVAHMHDSLKVNPINYESWYFYGCLGLETEQYDLAAEAFTRCVALDETSAFAWSNLATALLRLQKVKQAFGALKKAIRVNGDSNKSWRIYENYLIVATKLNEWDDVLLASRELLSIKNAKGEASDGSIDIPIVEKLAELLVSQPYQELDRPSHYQTSCIDFICNIIPSVITSSVRCWRVVARVELWRGKPWAALECHEKAYRAISNNPDLATNEEVWNEAVECCGDLVSAYENFGELPGKHGAGDLVCKDWKYKSRTTVRSLMSRGRATWEDSEGWERLAGMKADLA